MPCSADDFWYNIKLYKMKQYLFLFAFTVSKLQAFAQTTDFAPVGATWYYSEVSFIIPYPEKFRLVEVTGEEVFQGKLCRKIEGLTGCGLHNPCYVFSQNDSVFYWSIHTSSFQLLYDFRAVPGDSWEIDGMLPPVGAVRIQVDSLSTRVVGNDTLKAWCVSYSPEWFDWGTEILEKVGNTCFLGPSSDLCENGPCGIRCYSDSANDLRFVPYPCDTAIFTSKTKNIPGLEPINIYPNPFFDKITLRSGHELQGGSFQLFDHLGRLVLHQLVTTGGIEIETTGLPNGVYFAMVGQLGRLLQVEKLIKLDRE